MASAKRLQELIDAFKANGPGSTELEIRIVVDKIQFEKIVATHLVKASVRKIVSTLFSNSSKRGVSKIIEISEGKKNYIEKRTVDALRTPKYKVSVATETPIKAFTADNELASNNVVMHIRLKLRYSLPIVIDGVSWRLDVTAVRQVANMNDASLNLARYKADLFDKRVLDDTLSYELECELVDSELSVSQLEKAVHHTQSLVDDQYFVADQRDQWIATIALMLNMVKRGNTLKRILPQVVSLSYANYSTVYPFNLNNTTNNTINNTVDGEDTGASTLNNTINNEDTGVNNGVGDGGAFYATLKVDGTRCIAIVSRDTIEIVSHVYESMPLHSIVSTTCIFDVERYDDTLLVFDALKIHNKVVTELPFSERLRLAEDALKDLSSSPFQLKTFVKLVRGSTTADDPYGLRQCFESALSNPSKYRTDGLIITQDGAPYSNTRSYKWKPLEQTTIDFLLRRVVPASTSSSAATYIYYLFVGISKHDMQKNRLTRHPLCEKLFPKKDYPDDYYFPIQFTLLEYPEIYDFASDRADLDNKVVEMRYDLASKSWIVHRVREDRDVDVAKKTYFGNDYKVAKMTFANYVKPLRFEDLLNPQFAYFANDKASMYNAQTKAVSVVKSMLFSRFSRKAKIVLDLGSGKGQDLNRYYAMPDLKYLFCMDKDASALNTLVARSAGLKMKTAPNTPNTPNTSLNVFTICHDLLDTDVVSTVQRNMPKGYTHFDVIVCNLAFHYFNVDLAAIEAFKRVVDTLLRPGGQLLLTCFDGALVFDLLKDLAPEECWTYVEDHATKYSICKLYKSDTLANFGQQISVLLPMNSAEPYKEWLVNFEFIESLFSNTLELVDSDTFSTLVDTELKVNHHKVWLALDDMDKKYIGLYAYMLFVRKT